MFAFRVIFVVFLFGNAFCQGNCDLEALEKRVAQLEAWQNQWRIGFNNISKFSLNKPFILNNILDFIMIHLIISSYSKGF